MGNGVGGMVFSLMFLSMEVRFIHSSGVFSNPGAYSFLFKISRVKLIL